MNSKEMYNTRNVTPEVARDVRNAWTDSLPLAGLMLLVGCQTYALLNPHYRMFFLALGFSSVCLFLCIHGGLLLKHSRMLLAWLVFVATSEIFNVLNSAFPLDFRGAAFRLICYMLILAGGVMICRQATPRPRLLTWGSRAPLLFAGAAVAGGALVYVREINVVMAMAAASRFSGSEELHPVGIAYGYGTCLVILLSLLVSDRSLIFRLINIVLVLLLSRAIIGTGSRGALVAIVVVVVFLFLNAFKHAKQRGRVGLSCAIGIPIAVGLMTISLNEYIREQVQYYIYRFQALDYGEDASSFARFEIWSFYAKSFGSWFLTGYRNYSGDYPHNMFYEFWLRFGMVGLLCSIVFLYAIVKSGAYIWRVGAHPIVAATWAAMLFGFVNAQFNLALDFNRSFWLGIGSAVILAIPAFHSGKVHIAPNVHHRFRAARK